VAEKGLIPENLACAEFVSENWPIREKFPELKRAVGKGLSLNFRADRRIKFR